MNLFELTGQRLALQNRLLDLYMDEQTITDTLEAESGELEAKIQDYGFVIRNLDAFTKAMKDEEQRMSERRKAHEKRVEAIRDWLKENMERCGISKIECPAFTVSIRANPQSVSIADDASIPDEYMRQPETPPKVADKKAIAAALKSGAEIDGCKLTQSTRIEIK